MLRATTIITRNLRLSAFARQIVYTDDELRPSAGMMERIVEDLKVITNYQLITIDNDNFIEKWKSYGYYGKGVVCKRRECQGFGEIDAKW